MTETGPRIGIPVPTSKDSDYNHRSWPQYAEAVRLAGGTPFELALDRTRSELTRAADSCAGFLLPGSPADLDPARYGQDRQPNTADPDPAREECDWLLLERAEITGRPVLGICYGLQSLNVWRGGTLVQHLNPVPVNHEAGKQVAVAHSVLVAQTTLLAGLLTSTEAPPEEQFRRLAVNSSHHQAVAVPGEDLSIVARCPQDAVIEALEGHVGTAAMLGVQWHPERSASISATSRALFLWLVSEATDVSGFMEDVAFGNSF